MDRTPLDQCLPLNDRIPKRLTYTLRPGLLDTFTTFASRTVVFLTCRTSPSPRSNHIHPESSLDQITVPYLEGTG